MPSLEELIDDEDPGWPIVEEWIAEATNPVEVLARVPERSEEALLATQVTTRSTMGAVIFESGGILIDHGWLRILGGGSPRLSRSVPSWNEQVRNATDLPQGMLLIADDVLGGLFALNGGAFDVEPGSTLYFAPDSLGWEDLRIGYSDFLSWASSGDITAFWDGLRWPGWEDDVRALAGDQGFSIYPPLCTEPDLNIASRSRAAVPLAEVIGVNFSLMDQLG